MPRSWSARAVRSRFWSTLTTPRAADRNRLSRSGLARVPELIASFSSEDSRLCWSVILARSEVAKECRSRAYLSAVMPFTWWTPAARRSPLSGSSTACGRQMFTPPSASMTLTKPRKLTSMKSLMVSPVAFSTVATVSRGPPRPNAALILSMPCPGMSTHESRGRLTTVTLDRLAEMWISISVSELKLAVCPTCSAHCWAGVTAADRERAGEQHRPGPPGAAEGTVRTGQAPAFLGDPLRVTHAEQLADAPSGSRLGAGQLLEGDPRPQQIDGVALGHQPPGPFQLRRPGRIPHGPHGLHQFRDAATERPRLREGHPLVGQGGTGDPPAPVDPADHQVVRHEY